MKSREEILQAINDLRPCLLHADPEERKLAKITIDVLSYVIGYPSTTATGLRILRDIRRSQNMAATS